MRISLSALILIPTKYNLSVKVKQIKKFVGTVEDAGPYFVSFKT